MRASHMYFLLAATLLVPPAAIGQMVVVPNSLATTSGNSQNSAPFHCYTPSYSSMRYQQVYAGNEVGAGLIGEMRLRQKGSSTDWTTTQNGVTITLSSTTASPDALSSTFADNVGVDATEVFSGTLVLSNVASGATDPTLFSIVVPFQRSFPFDPSGGLNLLVDVTIPTCVSPEQAKSFDAENETGDAVSRLYGDPLNSSGVTDSYGLVTEFDFHVFADGFESGDTSAWSGATP